jgi:hypothetical protein
MGRDLMADEESRVFEAIGELRRSVENLSDKIDAVDERSITEHRKVHDIVVATSEAVRNVARDVAEMKPPVEDYRLKAAALSEAVELADDYKEKRAEDRGAEKFKKWLYGLAASVGGLIAILAGKLIDWLMARPHIPVIAVVALTIAIMAGTRAFGKDDGRYANSPHKDWVKGLKNKKGQGCCDTSDGYPADVEWDTDHDRYRVRIDGLWYVVPPDAVLTEPNRLGYPMVWYWRENGVPQIRCFIPGAGG